MNPVQGIRQIIQIPRFFNSALEHVSDIFPEVVRYSMKNSLFLYVGVKDNGEVCGVQDAKKLMEDIPNKVRDMMGIFRPLHASQTGKDVGRCTCALSESGGLGQCYV